MAGLLPGGTARIARSPALALCLMLLAPTVTQAQDVVEILTKAAGVPNIDALLPDRYSVEKTDPLVIDGIWNISTINKKIHIEQGRAVVIDPWLHLFVLKVKRDMVVLKDFQRIDVGLYTAYDLPLLGPATMKLMANGNLSVSVQGTLGPVQYELQQRELTFPQYFQAELNALLQRQGNNPGAQPVPGARLPAFGENGTPPPATQPAAPAYPAPVTQPVTPVYPSNPPAPQQPPAYPTAPAPGGVPTPDSDCIPIGVDPDTGATICAD